VQLFSSMKVLSEREFNARKSIMYQAYVTQVKMEAACLLDMIKTGVIPAVLRDLDNTSSKAQISSTFKNYTERKNKLYGDLIKATEVKLFLFSFSFFILFENVISLFVNRTLRNWTPGFLTTIHTVTRLTPTS